MSVLQSNLKLNQLLINIKLKKQYINKLQNQLVRIKIKNLLPKLKNFSLIKKKKSYLIKHVVSFTFTKSNTLLHVSDFSGKLKLFLSAGSITYLGEKKKNRDSVLRAFFRVLLEKGRFLKGQPIALHFKNVGTFKFKILKALKKKFLVLVVKNFNSYPYNGCRIKKIRRKKIRKKYL
jgi:ribosomal protein S11